MRESLTREPFNFVAEDRFALTFLEPRIVQTSNMLLAIRSTYLVRYTNYLTTCHDLGVRSYALVLRVPTRGHGIIRWQNYEVT